MAFVVKNFSFTAGFIPTTAIFIRIEIFIWILAAMFSPVQLPYFRDESLLPGPLPTTEEIKASSNVLVDRTAQRTVIVNHDFVVKYGRSIREREGQNLVFVEKYSAVPAPRLYAMYRDGDDQLYIIMERLPGQSLQSLWHSLQEPEKVSIMNELRHSIKSIRHITTSGKAFYGSVDGGSVPHHLFWTPDNNRAVSGPFSDEHSFNMGLVQQLRNILAHNNKHSYRADYFARHLDNTLHNNAPVFTHSDIQRKNILVQQLHQASDTSQGKYAVFIVDWENAGWYPTYWEYFAAFIAFKWDDDWPRKLEIAVDAYPDENAGISMIYHDLSF